MSNLVGTASKRCPRCGIEKPTTAFNTRRASRDGLTSACRDCLRVEQQRTRRECESQSPEGRARYRASRLDEINERQRAWNHRNRHRVAEHARRSRERNAAQIKAQQARWYKANVDHCAARDAARYRANADAVKALVRAWQRAHPERRREYEHRRKAAIRTFAPLTDEAITARLAYWGHRCWMCGAENAPEIDHVKPLSRGGPHLLANLRPACKPCNSGKRDRWPVVLNRGW